MISCYSECHHFTIYNLIFILKGNKFNFVVTERAKVQKSQVNTFNYFFFLVYAGSGPRPRTKRVKFDCTLSADYYNINQLYYYILLLNYSYGEQSQPKPETELLNHYFKSRKHWNKISCSVCPSQYLQIMSGVVLQSVPLW